MTSGTQITPLRRADIPELSQFLISGHGVPATYPLFSHEVLSWKYFDRPSDPSGDSICSLVRARRAGSSDTLEYVSASSSCRETERRQYRQCTPSTGWARLRIPAREVFLMLQAFATSKTQYAVGGSAQSQALFPRLGFEQKPKLATFRKVLAPFHRLRTTGQGLFHKWAGTAKDVASVLRARTPPVPQTVELRRHLRSPEKLIAYYESLHCAS